MILHCYEAPEDVPKGVEIADAALLLPRERVVRHRKTGSLALASDLFRLELQAAGSGIYVDADCYCVQPLKDEEFTFGWETSHYIASGVLRLPAESALLAAMRAIATTPGFIPLWETRRRKLRYRLRRSIGMPVPIENMRWGSVGPQALTHYAIEYGVGHHAKPHDVLYPVHPEHVGLFLDPEVTIADIGTSRTRVIHLWNEILRTMEVSPPPESPLAEIIAALET